MKISNLKKEDLETLAYDDIAFSILTSYGKKMKIQSLFKKICNLLNLSDKEFEDKIADFFELLSTDKRFIMLPNGYWDLKSNHAKKVEIDDDDDDVIPDLDVSDDDDDDTHFDEENDDDDIEDEYKDLVVIDPDEEEPDGL